MIRKEVCSLIIYLVKDESLFFIYRGKKTNLLAIEKENEFIAYIEKRKKDDVYVYRW